jgi:NAD(P)-dependent dehydrogenase (short-subunit alcohol dehydrogenase family)
MSAIAAIENINVLIIGASQGIGLGFVKKLLPDLSIAKIYATYRTKKSAVELINLAQEYPHKIGCLCLDITDESQIAESVAKISS